MIFMVNTLLQCYFYEATSIIKVKLTIAAILFKSAIRISIIHFVGQAFAQSPHSVHLL